MCLITKQICPIRARKDIVVYKNFEESTVGKHYYMFTSVRCIRIKRPEKGKYIIMDDTRLNIESAKHYPQCYTSIYGGMIHSYVSLDIAKSRHQICFKIMTFKCIIPKGTLYYKGINGDICSKKLLIIEEV